MKPGVYPSLSNSDYHGGPGDSKSGLDLIARSPMHFKAARDAANDNEPTAAQAFGTAFHALLLEPEEFVRTYCLGLRQSDAPDAIDDRDQLVAMVNELNSARLSKIPMTGSKAEQIGRIVEASAEHAALELEKMTGAQLKAIIEELNASRPGKLSTSGSRHELAEILRANGKPVTLWSDVQAEWMANNGHRNVLDQEAWDTLHAMRAAVMAHPAASALLNMKGGVAEHSVYWIDKKTAMLCRCRPDWWVKPRGIIMDVKTTDDASPEGFAKSIANWRYHVQHPFYLDGINEMRRQVANDNATQEFPQTIPPEARAFVFLAVEKKAPHAVGVYTLDSEAVALGRALYRRDLDTLAHCRATDTWPGYGDAIQSINVPAWEFTANANLLANTAA